MSTHTTIRNFIAAAAISTAIGLTSLAGGAASADGPSKPRGGGSPLLHAVLIDNENHAVPLLYQALVKNEQIKDAPTEEVAFYYNRIAFNYAATK